jgi:hypothetical protein
MPTDPTKFESLRPSAARVLAEIIDNVDDAADPAALMRNCDFEVHVANAIAGQIDEGLGDAAELRTLGLPPTWPRASLWRSTNRVVTRHSELNTCARLMTAPQNHIRTWPSAAWSNSG